MKRNRKKKARALTHAERVALEKQKRQIEELQPEVGAVLVEPEIEDLLQEMRDLEQEREEKKARKEFFDERRMNEGRIERIKSQTQLDERVVRLYEQTRDGIPTSDDYKQELLSPDVPYAEIKKAVRLGTEEWIASFRSKEF